MRFAHWLALAAVWVVYTTGVVQPSFGPGPSNGNAGVEFDLIDPLSLEPEWATTL
jgi:hypothetical protein